MAPALGRALTPHLLSPFSCVSCAPPRTPLNAVIGFNSLVLESGRLDPGNEECIRSSLTGASALLGIITQARTCPLRRRRSSFCGWGGARNSQP